MKVILHADDFGLDKDTCDTTIHCFQKGWLTSASILPKMSETASAIAFAKNHTEFSFGVHLTYARDTVESSVTDPRRLPSFTNANGSLLESNELRMRAIRGHLSVDEIALETEAQLALVRDLGLSISHVDSHGHFHKFKSFREAFKRVLPRFGIHRVRSAQNLYFKPAYKSPTYWLGGYWHRCIGQQWTTTDYFYMLSPLEPQTWWERCEKLFLRGGTIEVGMHPGNIESWRQQELVGLQKIAEVCGRHGIKTINWNDL